MPDAGLARSVALNEQELWREMVRWSGGLIHEADGLLFVAGPSRYLRVAIRLDGTVDGAGAVRRAGEFFAASESDHVVLVREPADADLANAACAAGYTPAWTERPMALQDPPEPSPLAGDIDVRAVSTTGEVLPMGGSLPMQTMTPASVSARDCCSATRRSSPRTSRRSSPTSTTHPPRVR
jgi:hypothetical protein